MMKLKNVITSIVFGSIVTYVVPATANEVMDWDDLNHYQLDCNQKQQQIEFLNSMRTTESDRQLLRLQLKLMPWMAVTDGDKFDKLQKQSTGRYEWLINQHLHVLASQCY